MSEQSVHQRLRAVSASQIGDVMDRLGVLHSGIRPMWSGARIVGRAVTAITAAGDNKILHEAIPTLGDGDVLVINGLGETNRALIGELMAERAQRKGCVGFVIDGAIRDVEEIAALGFPVYARAVTPAGPYRNGPGRLGAPVAIGGVVVSPGDWIVGDADGVVVIPRDDLETVLAAAERKLAAEAQQQRDIRAGLVDA